MEKTYVYDNVEVVTTSRFLVANLLSGKVDALHEITPKYLINGVWKKWINLNLLYEIQVTEENVNEQ